MAETLDSETVSTKQQRIATLAKQDPQRAFISLNHYLDLAWVREAFQRTRKDGAPGVDGQTWAGYAENLEANLQEKDRIKNHLKNILESVSCGILVADMDGEKFPQDI